MAADATVAGATVSGETTAVGAARRARAEGRKDLAKSLPPEQLLASLSLSLLSLPSLLSLSLSLAVEATLRDGFRIRAAAACERSRGSAAAVAEDAAADSGDGDGDATAREAARAIRAATFRGARGLAQRWTAGVEAEADTLLASLGGATCC